MQVVVLDNNFNQIAVVDEFESIIWDRKFNDVGYCEIYTKCNQEYLDLFQKHYYIKRLDDEMFCEIVSRKIENDIENGDNLTINALDVSSILNRRIIYNDINFNGKLCDFIYKIINDNFINPSNQDRKVANFTFDNSNFSEFTETIIYSTSKENVLELLKSLCEEYEIGFKVIFNNNNFVFSIYKLKDKSSRENENYVEFSNVNENLLSSEFEESDEELKNTILVSGEAVKFSAGGDETSTIYLEVSSAVGLERREMYLDSSLSQKYKDEDDVDHYYTDEEFDEVLTNAGKTELANNTSTISFNSEVDVYDTYKYKIDYDLGDIVKIKNRYNISANAKIVEIIESEDIDDGYQLEPVFEVKGGLEYAKVSRK